MPGSSGSAWPSRWPSSATARNRTPDLGATHPTGSAISAKAEALEALAALGLDLEHSRVAFFRLPDTAVPAAGKDGFAEAVALALAFCRESRPRTLLLPRRRDPHCDHRAGRAIFLAASADLPRHDEGAALRLDVTEVLPRKRFAIAAHRSRTTGLIDDDDPGGFRLSPAVLAHFDTPWEIYLEPMGL